MANTVFIIVFIFISIHKNLHRLRDAYFSRINADLVSEINEIVSYRCMVCCQFSPFFLSVVNSVLPVLDVK